MSVQRSVLDAALGAIAADGPDALSMRDVARRAGVSHQAPYHHFQDRAGIFAAIAAEGFQMLAADFRAALDEGAHPAEQCFRAYVRMALEHPGHFRVMFRADLCGVTTHPDTAAAAETAFEALQELVRRTVRRPLSPEEQATWSSVAWSCVHGFATLLIDGPLVGKLPPGVSVEEHAATVAGLMASMLEREAKRSSTPVRRARS